MTAAARSKVKIAAAGRGRGSGTPTSKGSGAAARLGRVGLAPASQARAKAIYESVRMDTPRSSIQAPSATKRN